MLKITNDLNEATFVTHAGNFHADDVFSTVFLHKYFKNMTLIRLKDYHDDGSKLAYDIGLGKFDHHGADYNQKRDDGIHYCSFGLLWREYGLKYLEENNIPHALDVFRVFDYLLVHGIDAIDNGEYNVDADFNLYVIDNLIALFHPSFNKDEDENKCFLEAVTFAEVIFDKVLKDSISKVDAELLIKEKISTIKNKVLILDEFIPYEFSIFDLKLDVDFVVFPSNRGGYTAHTVPTKYKSFVSKKYFNSKWAGLRDAELQKISGVKTARFCHKNLFLACADTLEDALKLIELSTTNNN